MLDTAESVHLTLDRCELFFLEDDAEGALPRLEVRPAYTHQRSQVRARER